ncbi:hypothetical protein CY34DRAFT_804355 [Suillus luteus UH-Slu-Lm8-n1]|uniref:Uncharacterized protein n=1 Tax=Suillus luteus UH-Slu-Lm8-n1 TaxID=930992 RepID=A0A0D0AM87_9AGAM|nr:hypothetical protein CY34DRAFT_804355 [Suillus luteus UH-Slu-Lm8-n1]
MYSFSSSPSMRTSCTLNLPCTLRQPARSDVVTNLLEPFETSIRRHEDVGLGRCHPPPGIYRVVHETSQTNIPRTYFSG